MIYDDINSVVLCFCIVCKLQSVEITFNSNMLYVGICSGSGSGSGLYSGGLTWSIGCIVLRCDDHTGIFTCDECARDPYFFVPVETQSYVIKLSCSRKVLAASGD